MGLTRDGEYTVYILQYFSPGNVPGEEIIGGCWCDCNHDSFGYPMGFCSGDKCWQETGIHGVYWKDQGMDGLRWVAERNLGHKFRLVKRHLTRKSTPISEITINDVEAENGRTREDVEEQV